MIYYRMNLQDGIIAEEGKRGRYKGNVEMDVSIFRSLRKAKSAFSRDTKAEIARLHKLRKECLAVTTRKGMASIGRIVTHEADAE